MNVACRSALLLALLPLAGCIAPVPLHVERSGTLPDARYAQFERATATLARVNAAGSGSFPEPKWVFGFDAAFDPHAAPLQIGSFTGRGDTASRVAGNLPAQLVRVIGEARLFPLVTLDPTPHAYVLSGTVTRAEDDDTIGNGAATQVEATVSRDGAVLGAMQINAMQVGIVPFSPLMLVVSAAMSAGQGTRSSFVAERFADLFGKTADGTTSLAWSGGMGGRYIYTPRTAE